MHTLQKILTDCKTVHTWHQHDPTAGRQLLLRTFGSQLAGKRASQIVFFVFFSGRCQLPALHTDTCAATSHRRLPDHKSPRCAQLPSTKLNKTSTMLLISRGATAKQSVSPPPNWHPLDSFILVSESQAFA